MLESLMIGPHVLNFMAYTGVNTYLNDFNLDITTTNRPLTTSEDL